MEFITDVEKSATIKAKVISLYAANGSQAAISLEQAGLGKSQWSRHLTEDDYNELVKSGAITSGAGGQQRTKLPKAMLLFTQVDMGVTTIDDKDEEKLQSFWYPQYGFDTVLCAARWSQFTKVESGADGIGKKLQGILDAANVPSEVVKFAGKSYVVNPTFRIRLSDGKWNVEVGTDVDEVKDE
jgi:hypothetical protein